MEVFLEAFITAFTLIINFDVSLFEIVGLSFKISVTSLLIASIIGFPIGVFSYHPFYWKILNNYCF